MMINVRMARIRTLSARDLMYSHHDVVGNVVTFCPLRSLIWDLLSVSTPRDTPTSCQ